MKEAEGSHVHPETPTLARVLARSRQQHQLFFCAAYSPSWPGKITEDSKRREYGSQLSPMTGKSISTNNDWGQTLFSICHKLAGPWNQQRCIAGVSNCAWLYWTFSGSMYRMRSRCIPFWQKMCGRYSEKEERLWCYHWISVIQHLMSARPAPSLSYTNSAFYFATKNSSQEIAGCLFSRLPVWPARDKF